MLLEKVMSWDQKKRGRFVRKQRRAMKLSRAELARLLGMSLAKLGRIERGEADVWLSEFFELCLVIGTRRVRGVSK
jgi:transcriptional regulator with XRE-family HTH domain